MPPAKKQKYLTKKTKFGGQEITLYSLDGLTWSTRPNELQAIMDRHANERILLEAGKEDSEEAEDSKAKKDEEEEDDDLAELSSLGLGVIPLRPRSDEDEEEKKVAPAKLAKTKVKLSKPEKKIAKAAKPAKKKVKSIKVKKKKSR